MPPCVERDMAVGVREFLRTLPAAAAASFRAIGAAGTAAVEGAGPAGEQGAAIGVALVCGDRRVEIALAPLADRRLGALVLPLTRVRIAFPGFSDAEAQRFLESFDAHYRRGGG